MPEIMEWAKLIGMSAVVIGATWRLSSKLTTLTLTVREIKDNDIAHIHAELSSLKKVLLEHLLGKTPNKDEEQLV